MASNDAPLWGDWRRHRLDPKREVRNERLNLGDGVRPGAVWRGEDLRIGADKMLALTRGERFDGGTVDAALRIGEADDDRRIEDD